MSKTEKGRNTGREVKQKPDTRKYLIHLVQGGDSRNCSHPDFTNEPNGHRVIEYLVQDHTGVRAQL